MSSAARLEPSRASVVALMDRVLRGGDPIGPEYPLVFDGRFPGRLIGSSEDGAVRSACAILARDFLVGAASIRIGLIGSVVTDPKWRGRGLASRVLERAEAALAADGCTLALLWGEEPDFYVKRGYVPIGSELDFVVPLDAADRLPTDDGIRALRPGASDDRDAVHALYCRHATRVDRTRAETYASLECPGMHTLVVERAARVVAYAIVGRGEDLTNVIHEWGGATTDVLALVRAHLEARCDHPFACDESHPHLVLLAPSSARELTEALRTLDLLPAEGFLGLGKALDADALARVLAERLGASATAQHAGDGTLRIAGPNGQGTLDASTALAILMGAPDVRADVVASLASLGIEDSGLPLEPFAWGLDSI